MSQSSSAARSLPSIPRALAAVGGLGLAVAVGTLSAIDPSGDLALLLVAGVAGLVLLALAYARFEAFVLAVLAIRASLDWTKAPSGLGEPTRPGTMTTALALLFLSAAGIWMLVQLKTGRLVPPSLLSLAWLAFVAIALVSAVAADRRLESIAEWGRIATVVGMLLVLQQMLGQGVSVPRVLVACFASAVIPLGMAAYQVVNVGASNGAARVQATFAHPNAFGFYLALLLVMGVALLPHVSLDARALLLIVLWPSAAALVMTYSRGSWIALIVGLVVVGFLQSPRTILLVVGVAAAVVLSLSPVADRVFDIRSEPRVAGVEGDSLAWRLGYWRAVVGLANESPIIGIGPKMTQYITDSAKVPHNDYLRAYVETGVLGLTAFAAMVAALIHTARHALRWAPPGLGQGIAVGFSGCVASFLIFSVAENLMSQVVVLWYFVAFAAAAVTASRWPGLQGSGPAQQRGSARERVATPTDGWR